MKKLLYIARYQSLAVLLLLLLALAPARAQIAVSKYVVYQGDTTTLSVTEVPYETYSWELYNDSTVDFAQVPGACPTSLADFVGGNIGSAVQVNWKEPGLYFYKVTAWNITGCTNNIRIGMIKVLKALPTAHLELNPDSICEGEAAELEITFTEASPWKITLQAKDIDGIHLTDYSGITDNPNKIIVNPILTTEYTVIEVSNVNGVQKKPSNSVILTVHPLPAKTPIYLKNP